jgi:hypothetical protein
MACKVPWPWYLLLATTNGWLGKSNGQLGGKGILLLLLRLFRTQLLSTDNGTPQGHSSGFGVPTVHPNAAREELTQPSTAIRKRQSPPTGPDILGRKRDITGLKQSTPNTI